MGTTGAPVVGRSSHSEKQGKNSENSKSSKKCGIAVWMDGWMDGYSQF
jgi:hypothetical protein